MSPRIRKDLAVPLLLIWALLIGMCPQPLSAFSATSEASQPDEIHFLSARDNDIAAFKSNNLRTRAEQGNNRNPTPDSEAPATALPSRQPLTAPVTPEQTAEEKTRPIVSPARIDVTLEPGERHDVQVQVSTGDAPIGKGDILFLFDRTNSMGDEIDQAKTSAIQIMEDIRAELIYAWFGLASFMDYPGYYVYPGYSESYGSSSAGDIPWQMNVLPTDDMTEVSTAINDLTLGYGEDWPEDYTRALFEASQVETAGWRVGAKKVIVLFGDAPTHDLNFAGYNFGGDPGRDSIAQTPDDLDFESVVQSVADKGISIIAVDSGSEAESQATFKGMSIGYAGAPGTNGAYFNLENATDIPSVVTNLVLEETANIDRLSLEVTSGFESWTTISPVQILDVASETMVTFDLTISVPSGTGAGYYPFQIQAIGDGAILGTISVGITVPSAIARNDLGFRPDEHGFRFANFSSTQSWEMFRAFFGTEQVEYSNGNRIHAADAFYEEYYRNVGGGGSCDGFSATSLINFFDLEQPDVDVFDMPDFPDLFTQNNSGDITEAIAFAQGIQMGFEKQQHAVTMCRLLDNSPSGFYQYARGQIQNGDGVIIAVRWPDEFGSDGTIIRSAGGHAIVAYRYEEPSASSAHLYVYDSNHPGDNNRRVEFDLDGDTWRYDLGWFTASGNSDTCMLQATPIDTYTHRGTAYWAQAGWERSDADLATNAQIFAVDGPARLLFIDDEGRKFGWDGQTFRDEIPGAHYSPFEWSVDITDVANAPGQYFISSGIEYDLYVKGIETGLADVSTWGDRYFAHVADIQVTRDAEIKLAITTDGREIGVESLASGTGMSLSVSKILGSEDRTVHISDLDMEPGETVSLHFDTNISSELPDVISLSKDGAQTGTYSLGLQRSGDLGYRSFAHADIALDPTSESYFAVDSWSDLDEVEIAVDTDLDGTIDERETKPDRSVVTSVYLDPAKTEIKTGGQSVEIIVSVRDQLNSFAPDGTDVTLSTTLGALSTDSAKTVGGLVTVRLTSGVETGLAEVTAQADAASGSTSIRIGESENFAYLPAIVYSDPPAGEQPVCTPDPPGESSNVADALRICSGQVVTGRVSQDDIDDVYRIDVAAGIQLTAILDGSGDDADLFLFPPGTTNVVDDPWAAVSAREGIHEEIDGTVLTGGTWYVDVYAYSGTTDYTLTVTLSSATGAASQPLDGSANRSGSGRSSYPKYNRK